MISQERAVGTETTPQVVKKVLLISPEKAGELRLATDGIPVFISPVIKKRTPCRYCSEEYSPLIYHVGHEIKAHHYHKKNKHGGGIYACIDQGFSKLLISGDWRAALEPVGEVMRVRNLYLFEVKWLRMPQARVRQIKAFCALSQHGEELAGGLVYSPPNNPDILLPGCSYDSVVNCDTEYPANIQYYFKIEDGQVLFS